MEAYFSIDNLNDFKWLEEDLESRTSCEIRLELRLDYEGGVDDISQQARNDFYKEGVFETGGQVGILILAVLHRKECAIWPDEGITAKIAKEKFDSIAKEVERCFKKGSFVDGIRLVFFKLGQLLEKDFPSEEESRHELVNDIIVDDRDKEEIVRKS